MNRASFAGPDPSYRTEMQRPFFVVLEAARSASDANRVTSDFVFGPALFIRFVNDLAGTFSQGAKHSLYEDDFLFGLPS